MTNFEHEFVEQRTENLRLLKIIARLSTHLRTRHNCNNGEYEIRVLSSEELLDEYPA